MIEPKLFNKEDWIKSIEKKYKGRNIPVAELHNERVKLENKYGEKIILGRVEDMETEEEKMDKIFYDILGTELSEVVPHYQDAENKMKTGYKLQRFYHNLIAEGFKKIFFIILGVLLLLTLIKYLFS